MIKSVLSKSASIFLMLIASLTCLSQPQSRGRFSIITGYGLAGSFVVRSYPEINPIQGAKSYAKKKFIGNNQFFTISYSLKNSWSINLGYTFQHFTRHIDTNDTLTGVFVYNYQTLHERNYIFSLNVGKNWNIKKNEIGGGLGFYYIRPKSERVDIYPRSFADYEVDFKRNNEEEGGFFAEFSYEYHFQPKVNLGIKTQFYFTASTGEAEAITLSPYIKIFF